MKKILSYILILFCCISEAAGQNVLSGKVLDKASKESLPGANIIIKSQSGNIVEFATTDNNGCFSLDFHPASSDTLSIEVSLIGYLTYSALIPTTGNQTLKIMLEEGSIMLDEVTVKADRIRQKGDTITYHVASFAQDQDRSIGDVLRRMPGIDVRPDGGIQYQGLDINKFYIEGSDLLGGKYGIATEGINHEDIGAVEVMENHQPMQVLRGISMSRHPAINLKLKSQSKATWVINGHAGLGWSNGPKGTLWDTEAFIMTILPDFQTITTVKSNNIGNNLSLQLKDFLSSRRNTEMASYFSVNLPDAPSFKENRTLFNKSYMFSTNNLWKINDSDIRFQLDYYRQNISSFNSTLTVYYLENGNHSVIEKRNGMSKENHLNGNLNLEINQKTYYLNNALKTELYWDKNQLDISGNAPIIQSVSQPDFYISNNLKLIRRFGENHLITFSSINELESMPQHLTAKSNSLYRFQKINNKAFYTNEQASYRFIFSGFNIALESGFEGYMRHQATDFNGFESEENSSNRQSMNIFKFFVAPMIEYNYHRIDFTLQYPFNIGNYGIFGAHKIQFLHSPSLDVKWQANSLISFSIKGGLGETPINLHNLYAGIRMKDYRTFTSGTDNLFINSSKNVSGRLTYRHGPNGLFANLFLMKSWLSTPYCNSQEFRGEDILYSLIPAVSKSQTTTGLGSISKTLDFMRGAISLNGSYTRMNSTMLSENIPTAFSSSILSLGPQINGNISNFSNFSYQLTYRRNSLSINHIEPQVANNLIHSFNLYVSPLKQLAFEITGEYYDNQLTKSTRKDMLLTDINLLLNLSKRIQIQASISNILNKKSYSYTTFSTLSSIETSRYIRGREFLITFSLSK